MINLDIKLPKMTKKEIEVLNYLEQKEGHVYSNIERNSDEEFDFTMRGEAPYPYGMGGHYKFIAGPKLSMIKSVNWIKFANISDYPDMVNEGDWSGIRDSNPKAIDDMFKKACKIIYID